MVILDGSGTNGDVAEESVMHPIIEAGIMKTRTRPRRTAGRTRLVWRGPPDRAEDQAAASAGAAPAAPGGPGRPRTGQRSEICLARRAGPDPGQACRQGTARLAGGLAVHDRPQLARGLGWPVTGHCRYQPGRAAAPGRAGRRGRRSRAGIVSGPAPVRDMPPLRRQGARRLRTFRPAISAVTAMARIRAGHPLRDERAVASLGLADTSRRLG
jgi:hypothetical protein